MTLPVSFALYPAQTPENICSMRRLLLGIGHAYDGVLETPCTCDVCTPPNAPTTETTTDAQTKS